MVFLFTFQIINASLAFAELKYFNTIEYFEPEKTGKAGKKQKTGTHEFAPDSSMLNIEKENIEQCHICIRISALIMLLKIRLSNYYFS